MKRFETFGKSCRTRAARTCGPLKETIPTEKRPTDKQIHGQTNPHTDRPTNRQTQNEGTDPQTHKQHAGLRNTPLVPKGTVADFQQLEWPIMPGSLFSASGVASHARNFNFQHFQWLTPRGSLFSALGVAIDLRQNKLN